MKKKNTIFEEVPTTEQGLKNYLMFSDRAIKDCQSKEKELYLAQEEARRRLQVIEDSRKKVENNS